MTIDFQESGIVLEGNVQYAEVPDLIEKLLVETERRSPGSVCGRCKHLIGAGTHVCPSADYIGARNALIHEAALAEGEFGNDLLERVVRAAGSAC